MVEGEPNSAGAPERTQVSESKKSGSSNPLSDKMASRGTPTANNDAEQKYLVSALENFQKEALIKGGEIVGAKSDNAKEGEETKSMCMKHNTPLNFWSNKE